MNNTPGKAIIFEKKSYLEVRKGITKRRYYLGKEYEADLATKCAFECPEEGSCKDEKGRVCQFANFRDNRREYVSKYLSKLNYILVDFETHSVSKIDDENYNTPFVSPYILQDVKIPLNEITSTWKGKEVVVCFCDREMSPSSFSKMFGIDEGLEPGKIKVVDHYSNSEKLMLHFDIDETSDSIILSELFARVNG